MPAPESPIFADLKKAACCIPFIERIGPCMVTSHPLSCNKDAFRFCTGKQIGTRINRFRQIFLLFLFRYCAFVVNFYRHCQVNEVGTYSYKR